MNITPAFSSLFSAFTHYASSNPKGIVLRLKTKQNKTKSSHIQVFKTPKESTSHIRLPNCNRSSDIPSGYNASIVFPLMNERITSIFYFIFMFTKIMFYNKIENNHKIQ
jgi:hypothetical protein